MIVTQLLWLSLFLFGVPATAPQKGVESGYVDVEGARLDYQQAGSGMAVVMIRGDYLDHHMWDDQFALVAEHYRAIHYDVRAHGRSSSDLVPFADHEDLRHLLDTLAVRQGGDVLQAGAPNRQRIIRLEGLSHVCVSFSSRVLIRTTAASVRRSSMLHAVQEVPH